jgi:hydroxyacylglutathione hydrolase
VRAATSRQAFADFILNGQPEPPTYFSRMKRLNRDGPPLLSEFARLLRSRTLSAEEISRLDFARVAIIDTRVWSAFKAAHLPGALRAPLDRTFNTIAGAYIREDQEIYLVAPEAKVEGAVRALIRVGLDNIRGHIEPATLAAYVEAGGKMESTPEANIAGAKSLLGAGALALDVRRHADEYEPGHIPGAINIPHLRLSGDLEKLPRDRQILVYCKSGGRSGRAAAFLQRAGFKAINLEGGFDAWRASGA